MNIPFTVRCAYLEEAVRLTDLCVRSKSVWRYPKQYIKDCKKCFCISPSSIALKQVLVVVHTGSEVPIAVSALKHVNCVSAELEYFFVETGLMGCGVGSLLYRATCRIVSAEQRTHLWFNADWHAQKFYEKMGARCVGHLPICPMTKGKPVPRFEHRFSQ